VLILFLEISFLKLEQMKKFRSGCVSSMKIFLCIALELPSFHNSVGQYTPQFLYGIGSCVEPILHVELVFKKVIPFL